MEKISSRNSEVQEWRTRLGFLSEPFIATLAAGLVFIDPALRDVSFVLVPVLFFICKKSINIKYFGFKN